MLVSGIQHSGLIFFMHYRRISPKSLGTICQHIVITILLTIFPVLCIAFCDLFYKWNCVPLNLLQLFWLTLSPEPSPLSPLATTRLFFVSLSLLLE